MLFRLRAFAESLLVPWFPAVCAGCSVEGGSPCVSCSEAFSPAHELGDISDLDTVVGLIAYDGVSRPFIADLKYRGRWATARAFAPALAMLLDDCIGADRPGPVLTWAPTTPDRARRRGFDQAEVIAREVGHQSGRPVRRLLDREPGLQQTGRSRRERSHGIIFRPRTEITGAVVVFDDVVTTGATLSAAGRALQDAGASAVVGVALAATPKPPNG
jgi:predicted amidophosphoribosyltransferase